MKKNYLPLLLLSIFLLFPFVATAQSQKTDDQTGTANRALATHYRIPLFNRFLKYVTYNSQSSFYYTQPN